MRRGTKVRVGYSRELAGEFSSEDISEDELELALEGRRTWKVWSGMESGVRSSGSDDASDMFTSLSASAEGKAKQLAFFGSWRGARERDGQTKRITL